MLASLALVILATLDLSLWGLAAGRRQEKRDGSAHRPALAQPAPGLPCSRLPAGNRVTPGLPEPVTPNAGLGCHLGMAGRSHLQLTGESCVWELT